MNFISGFSFVGSGLTISKAVYNSDFDSLAYLEAKNGARQLLIGMTPSAITPMDLFLRIANITHGSLNLLAGYVTSFSVSSSFAHGVLDGCIEGVLYIAIGNRIITPV